MRWTKGGDPNRAPFDTLLLVAVVYDRRRYFRIGRRVRGPWDGNYEPPRPTYFWHDQRGGHLDEPSLWWPLPPDR